MQIYSDFIYYTGTITPVVGEPVTVKDAGTDTVSTIYDSNGVAIANPVYTDIHGGFSFYVNDNLSFDIYVQSVKYAEFTSNTETDKALKNNTILTSTSLGDTLQVTSAGLTHIYGDLQVDGTYNGYTPVPTTRTVNGHALSADVTVSKSDVGLGNVTNESKATMFANSTLTGTTVVNALQVGSAPAFIGLSYDGDVALLLSQSTGYNLGFGNTNSPTYMYASDYTITSYTGDILLSTNTAGKDVIIGGNAGLKLSSGGTSLKAYTEGTFTATLTGCTTAPTQTCNCVKIGKIVTISMPAALSGTSNATTMTITGMNTGYAPLITQQVAYVAVKDNGGAYTMGLATIDIFGVITFSKDLAGTAFTSSGTKGVQAFTITYLQV